MCEALGGRSSESQGCRYFALAHSTSIHSPGSPLSLRLWLSEEPEAGRGKYCLVETSCNDNHTTCSVQFSLVAQSCLTFCDPIDCSTPGLPVHYLPELAQTHVHGVGEADPTISSSVVPFSCLQSFPASGSFPMSQLFTSGSQGTGVSASASVLPMDIFRTDLL